MGYKFTTRGFFCLQNLLSSTLLDEQAKQVVLLFRDYKKFHPNVIGEKMSLSQSLTVYMCVTVIETKRLNLFLQNFAHNCLGAKFLSSLLIDKIACTVLKC